MKLIRFFLWFIALTVGVVGTANVVGMMVLNVRLPNIEPTLPQSLSQIIATHGQPDAGGGPGLNRWTDAISIGGFIALEKNVSVIASQTENVADGSPVLDSIFEPGWTALEVVFLNGVGEQRHPWGALCFFDGLMPRNCDVWGLG